MLLSHKSQVLLGEAAGTGRAARFNPAVTLFSLGKRRISVGHAVQEICAQTIGAMTGVVVANTMFGAAAVKISTTKRVGWRLLVSEVIATVGLLVVIELASRKHSPVVVAANVAGYIAGAYFFAASTSFANPAITFGRVFTDSYTGITPVGAIAFVLAQLGAVVMLVAMLGVIPARR